MGTLLGLSVPVFWQGTMLILFFSLYLRWMPPVVWVDFFTDPRRNLTIMLLPALCLGTASAANIARTTRACMLDVLRSEYIRTAAAKGLAGRVVVLKHALKNALIPVVTVAGLQIGILLGGTVVVEEVFTLPGIGRLVLWSIYQRDYPLTQSTILFIAVLFMAINLAVDLLYGYLDPRIRYSALNPTEALHARIGSVRAGQAAQRVEEVDARAPRAGRGARAHGGERRLPQLPARRRRLLEGRAACPIVLGDEGAGVVEALGPGVTELAGRRSRDPLVGAHVRALPLLRDRPAQPLRAPAARQGRAARRHHADVACAAARLPLRPRGHLRLAHRRARVVRDPHRSARCRSTARRSSAAR